MLIKHLRLRYIIHIHTFLAFAPAVYYGWKFAIASLNSVCFTAVFKDLIRDIGRQLALETHKVSQYQNNAYPTKLMKQIFADEANNDELRRIYNASLPLDVGRECLRLAKRIQKNIHSFEDQVNKPLSSNPVDGKRTYDG